MSRRTRQSDPLASPLAVQAVLVELVEHFPALAGFNDQKLQKLLFAVRHQETYPATETQRGRPPNFGHELIQDTCRHLKAILLRETKGRISVQTFIGHYLPIISWPENVIAALSRGELSRLEAAQVARLTAERLGVKEREAAKIREEMITRHVRAHGSQTALREQVREALGEVTLVTSEKMAEVVRQVDELLEVNSSDRRHLFYEQMKDLFYLLREVKVEELDDELMEVILRRADDLLNSVNVIFQRRKEREMRQKRQKSFNT